MIFVVKSFSALVLAAVTPVHPVAPAPVDPVVAAGSCPAASPSEGELAILLWEQRTRTPEEMKQANSEVMISAELFAEVVGGAVAVNRPLTKALLEEAMKRAVPVLDGIKARCARARPFTVDMRIQPAVPREPTFSFPSGHATRGQLLAELLAELLPSRRAALLERGRQIGFDRVRAGVHFPSDVEAGQRVGHALVARWLSEPSFRERLERARAQEWGRRADEAEAQVRPRSRP